jgi:hypothetical protein
MGKSRGRRRVHLSASGSSRINICMVGFAKPKNSGPKRGHDDRSHTGEETDTEERGEGREERC